MGKIVTSYDAIVIGAGHNGLTAAGYLAREGRTVLVLEASDSVGGLCQTREVLPGLRGNFAANSSHNLDPLVVADLELEKYGLQWVDAGEPSSMALLPDQRRIIAYHESDRKRAEYDQFGAGEGERYDALLSQMSALGRALDVSFYESPPSIEEVAARVPADMRELFNIVMFGSVADLADSALTSPHVKASLGMLAVAGNYIGAKTAGSAYPLIQRPLYRGARAARDITSSVLGTSEYASASPRGGMGAITQAMAASAQAHGAKIRTQATVEHIIVEGGRAVGVVLGGGDEIHASLVLSAISPLTTMKHLVDAATLPPEFAKMVADATVDGCMAKVYLALDGAPVFAAARSDAENVLMSRLGFRAGPSLDAVEDSYQLSLGGSWKGEPVVYGLTQTMFDDSLDAGGRHLMSLSVSYAPYQLAEGDWESQREPWTRHIIDWLSQHITNLPDIITDYGSLTTAELHDELGVYRGNALHGDVTAATMFHSRPFPGYSDYSTPINGLYLASNGTWPANYVSGLSGRNSALAALSASAPL